MNSWIKVAMLGLLFMWAGSGMAQNAVSYKITGENIFASISLQQEQTVLDSTLESFGFTSLEGIETQKSTIGWKYHSKTSSTLTLVLNKNSETKKLPNAYVINDAEVVHVEPRPTAAYGLNNFKERSVKTSKGVATFSLAGFENASHVYLSGSFNDWSTLKTPMKRTDKGWEVSVNLQPGKYLYKFIVDGRWMHDKTNRNKENDGNDGYNSVYFVYNYVFKLAGYQTAKRVSVAGSFCDWRQLRMRKNEKAGQWELPLYLSVGTHAYKFVVDENWMVDPANRIVRDDGAGNRNSFTSVGDTTYFNLLRQHDAEAVYVAGSFNAWNFTELSMNHTFEGWELPYVLAPGNYEYKFRIGEHYFIDPENPHTNGEEDMKNSVKFVEPNYTFTLRGYGDARTVILTGSFNGWSTNGYTMKREDGAWRISIYLPRGKTTYKFVVDGEWIIDPENKLWERNEYDTKNSVIWVDEYSAEVSP